VVKIQLQKNIMIAVLFAITGVLSSCITQYPSNGVSVVSEEIAAESMPHLSNAVSSEMKDASEEPSATENELELLMNQENSIQFLSEQIDKIDFTVKEYPIEAEIANSEINKLYKEAYFKAVHNAIPMERNDVAGTTFYQELFRGKPWSEEEFENFVLKRAKYHYTDFDTDGFPELCIEKEGLSVLKYIPEKKQMYLYYSRGDGWHIMGAGQLYYYDTTSANRVLYVYESLDPDGEVSKTISFDMNSTYDVKTESWHKERYVDIDGKNNVLVTEQEWEKLTSRFFEAIKEPIPSQTYDEVFEGL
jgi:hypothetical protein